jgi:hypothetical protein
MRRAAPAALLLLAAAGAAAQTADAPPATCRVDGYDVVLINTGTDPLPQGTGFGWSVPFARAEGVHVLEGDLAPGRVIVLTGALGSSFLRTTTECIATLQ